MFKLEDYLEENPFSFDRARKEPLYIDAFNDLNSHHYNHCPPYKKILDILHYDPSQKLSLEEMPFIPVRLFKDYEMLSVPKHKVIKTMTSSGTSGQSVSKIFLDQQTATHQTKVLVKIVSEFTGKKRLPMLIIDTKSVLKDRNLFSARGAGILGFSMLGHDTLYALKDDMKFDFDAVAAFCNKYKDERILIFGFTFMIWEYFYKTLLQSEKKLPLKNAFLIHGGGWKKLLAQSVDNPTFKSSLESVTGIKEIHNYYGMVEQTGSIFMECSAGFLHSSLFSDVIIRRNDFSVAKKNEKGLIQLLSLLPFSYPGHSILSEDIGEIIGEDDCACGLKGKYFIVYGRTKNAELRGCSDVAKGLSDSQINNSPVSNLTHIIGNEPIHERPLEPYSNLACDFLNDLSGELRSDPKSYEFPDIVAFAFWCRKANVAKMKTNFEDGKVRLGLGTAFHITPSNVPINFAFSFAFGLLSGNANIVRVPTKPFPQTDIVCTAIKRLFEKGHNEIKKMTSFVLYERNDEITRLFSSQCNARIIWGGDLSIQNIRKFPIPERSIEITFADRYSFAILNADSILKLDESELKKLTQNFYNDAYLMDQHACSSPHLIIWQGDEKEAGKEKFWDALAATVKEKYSLLESQAVDKLTLLCHDALELNIIKNFKKHDTWVYRLSLENLSDTVDQLRGTCGYFYEYEGTDTENLTQIINNKYQTLTYFGINASALKEFVLDHRLTGIDRIVPVGQALEMDIIWDGYDVVKTLSRIIDIKS